MTYANGLTNPFVYDDVSSVTQNRTIRELWPLSRPLSPPRSGAPTSGRPLVNLTLAIDYALGGDDPFWYHATNLALHAGCALVLFGIIRRTLTGGVLRMAASRGSVVAARSALVWGVHPLQSEVVDYVSARTESAMALCFLLTLYCWIRAREKDAPAWFVASVAACAAGMACKETMVVAPVAVVLYDAVFHRAVEHASKRRVFAGYGALASTWVVLWLLTRTAPRGASAGLTTEAGLVDPVSSWTYLLDQGRMIARYLRLVAWPSGLVLDYGVPRPTTIAAAAPYAAVVGALGVMTIVALKKWPPLGFAGAWCLLTLAPASSIVPVYTEVGAERRMYLPAMAIVTALVVMAALAVERKRMPARVAIGVCAAVAVALSLGTIARTREYSSGLSIWQTVVDRWPHGRARYHLATELKAEGRTDDAVGMLREAAQDYPDARYALGLELFASRQYAAAIQELEQFVRDRPLHLGVPGARETIGRALAAEGRPDEAAAQFQALLQMAPSYAAAHGRLADVLFGQRQFERAAAEYRLYLAVHPDDPGPWTNLGIALHSSGRVAEAIAAFQRAAALQPGSGAAHRNLANALLAGGDAAAAAREADEALRLVPSDPVAREIRAEAAEMSKKR